MLITFCEGCCNHLNHRQKLLFESILTHFHEKNSACLLPDDDEDLDNLQILEKKQFVISTEMESYILIKPKCFPVVGEMLFICFGKDNE